MITRDTTLTHDITGCTGTGLVIGADDVTLDLAGHTLSGDSPVGVDVTDHDGVVITNGSIERFYVDAVRAHGADDIVVSDIDGFGVSVRNSLGVEISSSSLGSIDVSRSANVHIEENRLPGQFGLSVEDSVRGTIRANEFAIGQHDSLSLYDSGGFEITENVLPSTEIQGIYLFESQDNLIADNEVHGSGIGLLHSSDNVVTGNELERGYVGISFGSDGNLVSQNNVTGGSIAIGGRSDDNVVVDNSLHRGRIGVGVRFSRGVEYFFTPARSRGDLRRNRVRDNVVINAPGVGIKVQRSALGGQLKGNEVLSAKRSGIVIKPHTLFKVSENDAEDNGGHGIVAAEGTRDGGGNVAGGNLTPPQCINIDCARPTP